MAPAREKPILLDIGLLIVRLMLGVVFMFHGSQKLFSAFDGPGVDGFAEFLEKFGVPAPYAASVLTGCVEFFGGALVFLGLFQRLAVIPMIAVMLVAAFLVHRDAFSNQRNGMEFPLTLAAVLGGLGFTGPGRISISGLFRAISRR